MSNEPSSESHGLSAERVEAVLGVGRRRSRILGKALWLLAALAILGGAGAWRSRRPT